MTTIRFRTSADTLPPAPSLPAVPPPPPSAPPAPGPKPQPAPGAPHTLEDLCAAYLADVVVNRAPRTQKDYHYFFGWLTRCWGPLPLDALTPEFLRGWKAELQQQYGPATVRRYLCILSGALTAAVDDYGWLPVRPMARVRKPKRAPGRVRFLLPEERTRLLESCQRSRNRLLSAVVMLALGTGGRREELRCLRWTEVDFRQNVIRFLETKTDQARAVPLARDTLGLMQTLAQTRQGAWVFPSDRGAYPMHFQCAWRTAREKAGLCDLHFHDLRHTYASYLAMSGASLRVIADLLGHKSIQQTMVYTHLMPSHTRSVVEQMHQQFLTHPPAEGSTHDGL